MTEKEEKEEEKERLKRLLDGADFTKEEWNAMLAEDELKRLQKEKETEEGDDDDDWFEPENRECDTCEKMFVAYYEEHEDCDSCRWRQQNS